MQNLPSNIKGSHVFVEDRRIKYS